MLLKDPTFAKKLNDTVTQADSLVTAINEGKGRWASWRRTTRPTPISTNC